MQEIKQLAIDKLGFSWTADLFSELAQRNAGGKTISFWVT
jgi:hypothetical protein